jgi:hypothetical protein
MKRAIKELKEARQNYIVIAKLSRGVKNKPLTSLLILSEKVMEARHLVDMKRSLI